MSETIVVTLITATAGVLVAAIGVAAAIAPTLLGRLRAIEEQVANDHKHPDGTPINLRDDLDDKHDENKTIATESEGILLAVQRDVSWIMRQLAGHENRIDHLEDTVQTERTDRS